jgi:hypothetical protein
MNMKKATKIPLLKERKARILFCNSIAVLVFLGCSVTTAYTQNIGINTTGATPNSKVMLDINADNVSGEKKGLLIPRMNTTERNALSATGATTESLLIYNTTTHCFEAWNQSVLGWVAFGCLNCQMPSATIASAATNVGCHSFTANWSVSGGASSYYLDVSTDINFASLEPSFSNLPVSTVTSYPVTGLTANIIYYYRVRAYNDCGTTINSNSIAVTALPSATLSAGCHPCQVEADYGTVQSTLSGSTQTWITRNLGATAEASAANSVANSEAGCYFQFNRSQAFGFDNGGTVNPDIALFSGGCNCESNDWLISNDPCRLELGGSWRLPTEVEWANTISNGPWTSYTDTYTSALKIHAAGDIEMFSTLTARGAVGYYWSSDFSAVEFAASMGVDSSSIGMGIAVKGFGLTVRCLK